MKVSIQTLWSHIYKPELSANNFKMVAVHTCRNIMEKFNKTYDDIFNIFIDKSIISVNRSIIEAEVLGDILNETHWIWDGKNLKTDTNYTLSGSTDLIVKSANSGEVIELDEYITDKCETEIDYCNALGFIIAILVHWKKFPGQLYRQALEKAFPNKVDDTFINKSIKDFLN